MKLRTCFEINGLGVDEKGEPSPVGLCVVFDVGASTNLPPYQRLVQSVNKEGVLRMVGLDGLVGPEDMNFITPEEYNQDYGDDGGGHAMKHCKTCCWYEDYEGACLNPDSEHCAEPVAVDAGCEVREGVGP